VKYQLAESTIEDAALELFSGLGYAVLHGPDIAPGELFAEQADCTYRSRMLGALRYTLLPKLISGEIRVKDTEKSTKVPT
jgi:hypothetical protein